MADQQPPEFSEVLALLSVAVDLAKERDDYKQIGHEIDTVAVRLVRRLDEAQAENAQFRWALEHIATHVTCGHDRVCHCLGMIAMWALDQAKQGATD